MNRIWILWLYKCTSICVECLSVKKGSKYQDFERTKKCMKRYVFFSVNIQYTYRVKCLNCIEPNPPIFLFFSVTLEWNV